MTDPLRLSAEAIAAGVAAGELSALETLEAALSRIESVEPRVGAFLAVGAESARAQARAVDDRRRRGERPGRLAGVPIALKDNLAVSGSALTCGSRILEGYVAPFTSTAVARCLEEGAVVVGRTNLDEFAMGSSCENSAFGPTRNPWDLSRVPGGSSGGSAAAVASGCVPLALGSDTGGSVRQPASFCGVVGLKPSYGRVSRSGLVAFASSLDQIGPLSRQVRDAALALDVISGPDGLDATAAPHPPSRCLEGIDEGLSGMRVGVLRELAEMPLAADSRRSWDEALRRLEALGSKIVEVSIPHLPAAIAVYYVLANSEASANLARFDGVRYGRRAAAGTFDAMISRSRGEGFGPEVKRRIMLGTYALSSGYYDAYYARAKGVGAALRQQFDEAFRAVDLIATPTTPGGAFRLGEKSADPLAMYLSDIFTAPANLAGLPAIALPAGFDSGGLPLSLQLMAKRFDEERLLRAARAFELNRGPVPEPGFRGAVEAA